MGERIRVEVDRFDEAGPRTSVVFVDVAVSARDRAHLEPIVQEALAAIPHPARLLLLGELAERIADADAYERECARRGVLAL